MILDLIYLDSFDSTINNEAYKVYVFIDPYSKIYIYGSNLEYEGDLIPYTSYKVNVEYKRNKLKATSLIS